MPNPFDRTIRVLGERRVRTLLTKRVAVVGLGGVGGYAVEALARAPVGALVLIDPDRVAATDINRQISALSNTLGRFKAEVLGKRVRDIRPETALEVHCLALEAGNIDRLLRPPPDVVVDAVDDVDVKVRLLRWCLERAVPVVSSMGAGFRTDPARVRVADISATHGCPLARVVRRRLRAAGIREGVRAVFSDEPPLKTGAMAADGAIGSVSWCPGVFGLVCAGEAIRVLLGGIGNGEKV